MACNSRWGTLETQSTLDIAIKGTQNTLSKFGPSRRFVYVSSAAAMIFDDDFEAKQKRNMACYPKDSFIYSKAKAEAEAVVRK